MSELIPPATLARSFYEHVTVSSVYQKSARIDGKVVARARFFKLLVASKPFLKKAGATEVLALDDDEQRDYADAFNEVFFSLAREKLREVGRREAKTGSHYGDAIDYTAVLPVIDVQTGSKVLMNPKNNTLSSISYDVWEQCIPPEVRNEMLGTRINAVLRYDPYNLSPHELEDFEGVGRVLKINKYVPPSWRLDEDPYDPAKVVCPPEILRFLRHLIPDRNCRRFVLSWLHYALVRKSETYLVMNAAKGVGKGIFSLLLKALVGREHYTEAHRGFLDTQFNSLLANRRMVVLDEIAVNTAEKVNKLKSYINRYQNIEGKFKNAEDAIEIFTSFMISNNSVSDMHIESDDRRFSVVDITEKPLRDLMSALEIRELTDAIENDLELQKQFGRWILHKCRSDEYDAYYVWKGPKYHELVYQSLTEWQRYIIELLQDNPQETYSHRDLTRGFSREAGYTNLKMASRAKIADFLKNYREHDELVGMVTKGETGAWAITGSVDALFTGDEEGDDL